MLSFRRDIIVCVLFWRVMFIQSYLAISNDLIFTPIFFFGKDHLWNIIGHVLPPESEKYIHYFSFKKCHIQKVVGGKVSEKLNRFCDESEDIIKQFLKSLLFDGLSKAFTFMRRNITVFPCMREYAQQAKRVLTYPSDFNNRFNKNFFELANSGFYFDDDKLICFSCQKAWSIPDLSTRDQAQWHDDGCNHYKTLTNPSQGVNNIQALFANQDSLEENDPNHSPSNIPTVGMGSGVGAVAAEPSRADCSEGGGPSGPSEMRMDGISPTIGSEFGETARSNNSTK